MSLADTTEEVWHLQMAVIAQRRVGVWAALNLAVVRLAAATTT